MPERLPAYIKYGFLTSVISGVVGAAIEDGAKAAADFLDWPALIKAGAPVRDFAYWLSGVSVLVTGLAAGYRNRNTILGFFDDDRK